jgi:ribokinase
VAAARLGTRVAVLSALADDAVKRLKGEGVRVSNLRRPGEAHAVSVSLSTPDERALATFDGVNAVLEARLLAALARRLPRAAHVHLALGPRQIPAWTGVLERLRARGIGTSWDFGWHEQLASHRGFERLLRALDWVFVNEREARLYTGASTLGQAITRWRGLARHLVVKHGPKGALVSTHGSVLRVPAPRVRVVDTTGAGDAFNGGFLAALLQHRDPEACLRLGVQVGSLSTRAAGGLDGLPHREDMNVAWGLGS